MHIIDNARATLAARLASMKHSIEAERSRLESHQSLEGSSPSSHDPSAKDTVEMRLPRIPPVFATPARPLHEHDHARSPPLRRARFPGVPLSASSTGVHAREYTEFSESYTTLHEVHAGTYGTVTCAIDKSTSERVAVKTIRVRRETVPAVKREIEISLRLRHPSIIKTLGVYSRREDNSVLIVQEYASGGDLFEFITTHGPVRDERVAKSIFTQLCSALIHMHENAGVAHRDLKPENVLLLPSKADSGEGINQTGPGIDVRLIDFGLSQYLDTTKSVRGMAGTEGYISPEVAALPANGNGFADGRASDVWGLAVTMYTVLMASLPWNAAVPHDPYYSEYLMRRNMGEMGAVFGHNPEARMVFTRALGELFDRMLTPSPTRRISLKDALEYAKLPWFVSENEPQVVPRHISVSFVVDSVDMSNSSVSLHALDVAKQRATLSAWNSMRDRKERELESVADFVQWMPQQPKALVQSPLGYSLKEDVYSRQPLAAVTEDLRRLNVEGADATASGGDATDGSAASLSCGSTDTESGISFAPPMSAHTSDRAVDDRSHGSRCVAAGA